MSRDLNTQTDLSSPGTHSNVGGGYDDQELANITLAWMMSQLAPFLDMRDEYLFEQDEENDRFYRKDRQEPRPWGFGEIYNSLTGLFALGGNSVRVPRPCFGNQLH